MSKITSTRFIKVVLENDNQCRRISAQQINAFERRASYKNHDCDFGLRYFELLREEYPDQLEISQVEIRIINPVMLKSNLQSYLKRVTNVPLDKSILKIWKEVIQEY